MKKIAFLLILITVFLNLTSCNLIDGFLGTPNDNSTESGENGSNTPPDPEDNENKTDGPDPDLINVKALRGLNEQIFLSIEENEELSYKVFYKGDSDTDYTELDSNLMISAEGNIDCYLLGIKSGKYDIKIEAENEKGSVAKTYSDITVASQDRSGYAHFGYTEGVGAYNDDGTVKEGTRIIYVNNDNKNTVSLTIDGTEYVGLVNILQAQYKSDVPMLVRIIGKITTNQWNYKNVEPRLSDGSNATGDFFENTFSDEYGENLANLIVKMKGNGGGEKTYNYRTTPEGLSDVRLTNGVNATAEPSTQITREVISLRSQARVYSTMIPTTICSRSRDRKILPLKVSDRMLSCSSLVSALRNVVRSRLKISPLQTIRRMRLISLEATDRVLQALVETGYIAVPSTADITLGIFRANAINTQATVLLTSTTFRI